MRILYWLKDYWYIPVFFIAAIGGLVLSYILFKRPDTSILEKTNLEIKAIQAGAEARQIKAELGAEQAKAVVAGKYMQEMAALDTKQKAQAVELENDPVALAKYLVRVGGSK